MITGITLIGKEAPTDDPLTARLLALAVEHGGSDLRSGAAGSAVAGAVLGDLPIGAAIGTWLASQLLQAIPDIVFSSHTAFLGFLTISASVLKEWLRARANRSVTIKVDTTTITLKGATDVDAAITSIQRLTTSKVSPKPKRRTKKTSQNDKSRNA